MNEQSLLQSYNENPTPTTFIKLIECLRSSNKKDIIQTIRLDYIQKFSMHENMWIQWLEEEFNPNMESPLYNQLLLMALNDLPLSSKLRIFHVQHLKKEDRIPAIKQAIEIIGDFDNSIWDLYRKEAPEDADEIYQQQLSHPVPNYSNILAEYNKQQEANKKPIFTPSQEIQEAVTTMKLHRADFQTLPNCLHHLKSFPSERSFEYALSIYPYEAQIWIDYLTKFPSEKLATRAVRFCPKSGLVWTMYTKITSKVNLSGFNFIKDLTEAQIYLSQLVALDNDNSIQIVQEAIQMPAFSQADGWIWPTFLLEELIKTKNPDKNTYEERRALFEEAVSRNSQSYELWSKLILIVSETNDENEIRNAYHRASSELKVDISLLVQDWMIFEATSNDKQIADVVTFINQTISKSSENEETSSVVNPNSVSEEYERRTIFVANLPEDCNDEELSRFFGQIGEVVSVRLKLKHGKPSFAFVEFRSIDSADQSVQMLNGAQFKGSQLEIKPHETQNKLTLFIRYSTSAQPGELIDFLKKNAQTSNFKLRLANEKNDKSTPVSQRTKGWGFIDVPDDITAMKIMSLSGKLFKTQVLKIEVANKNQKEAHHEKVHNKDISNKPKQQNRPKYVDPKIEQEGEMNDDELKDFFGL